MGEVLTKSVPDILPFTPQYIVFLNHAQFQRAGLTFLLCQLTHFFLTLLKSLKLSVMTEETSVSDRIPERPQSPASSASSSDWAPRTSISPGNFLGDFFILTYN